MEKLIIRAKELAAKISPDEMVKIGIDSATDMIAVYRYDPKKGIAWHVENVVDANIIMPEKVRSLCKREGYFCAV